MESTFLPSSYLHPWYCIHLPFLQSSQSKPKHQFMLVRHTSSCCLLCDTAGVPTSHPDSSTHTHTNTHCHCHWAQRWPSKRLFGRISVPLQSTVVVTAGKHWSTLTWCTAHLQARLCLCQPFLCERMRAARLL